MTEPYVFWQSKNGMYRIVLKGRSDTPTRVRVVVEGATRDALEDTAWISANDASKEDILEDFWQEMFDAKLAFYDTLLK